ncbi:MAG: sigma-54-dependent Fis family transcriptional regulator [Phycisphaerae bacterium]|nr:sigma-54-dependent Fis family transcriptional regulator [Phycisphaerae bacterium]
MPDTSFVLIVENEPDQGEAMADALRRAGFACHLVHNVADALASIRHRPPDVVVTEYELGNGENGFDVFRATKRKNPDAEVLILSARNGHDRELAVADGEFNPYDFVAKPVDMVLLVEKVRRAAKQASAALESRMLRKQMETAFDVHGIIGTSDAIRRELRRLGKIAPSKSTVLIFGETGTGKELFAQAIHHMSPRAGKPFKVINCAAVSETLLESELFGHVKGAFTGAIADRKGLVEAADGGTLFLDEIGDMPLMMQAKLLRTLETGEVMRVGSNDTQYFDVRFVAATNRDLNEGVREGKFREDLFYRLHAHGAIRIPPLRQRREDIPVLVRRFIDDANREYATEVISIAPEVMRKLMNYQWPGNVRELRSVIYQMCLEAEGEELAVDDLPPTLRPATDIVHVGVPNMAGMSMADVERLHIMNTLRMYGGNREKTANALGIGARTLYRKLRDYGLR